MPDATFTCSLKAPLNNAKAKTLLSDVQAPAPTRPQLDLNEVTDTLKSLSKATVDLQEKANTPTKQGQRPQSKQQASAPSKPSASSYSAITGSRPRNPSIVVGYSFESLQRHYCTALQATVGITDMETCGYSNVVGELSECGVTSC